MSMKSAVMSLSPNPKELPRIPCKKKKIPLPISSREWGGPPESDSGLDVCCALSVAAAPCTGASSEPWPTTEVAGTALVTVAAAPPAFESRPPDAAVGFSVAPYLSEENACIPLATGQPILESIVKSL